MVAVEAAVTTDTASIVELDPREAAEVLVRSADEAWLRELQRSLDRRRSQIDIDRILDVWDLSQSEVARLFGVSRQAIGKWRRDGAPQAQVPALADLAAATDLLVRHLKRDRIPTVVRRPAAFQGGRSLIDMVAAGSTREVLESCRAMFAFEDAHG
jgi:DNA-binding transcriptional regulator YiaG